MKRGRPKNECQLPKGIETYEFIQNDGTKTIWTWNKEKDPTRPISVEVIYPSWYTFPETPESRKYEKELDKEKKRQLKSKLKREDKKNKDIPKTKQKYLAPSGKMVGYTRAKELGLI